MTVAWFTSHSQSSSDFLFWGKESDIEKLVDLANLRYMISFIESQYLSLDHSDTFSSFLI